MASSTTNLDLILPVGGENVSRQIINANNVKIDEAVGAVPSGTDLQSQVIALNSNITTIHPTTELGTMSDLVSLINETASGLFVNCRIGATIVNKLCGVSARQGTITAFKSNASSDYIEYTVIDTEAVVYSGFYKISTDTATYNQFALNRSVDITTDSDGNAQVDSKTSNAVTASNFINAFCIDSNEVVIMIYTYNNKVYVDARNKSDYSHKNGTYTVRIIYR